MTHLLCPVTLPIERASFLVAFVATSPKKIECHLTSRQIFGCCGNRGFFILKYSATPYIPKCMGYSYETGMLVSCGGYHHMRMNDDHQWMTSSMEMHISLAMGPLFEMMRQGYEDKTTCLRFCMTNGSAGTLVLRVVIAKKAVFALPLVGFLAA